MAEDKNTVKTPKERYISGDSTKWKNWMSVLAPTTCLECAALHGTIYPMSKFVHTPKHINGMCSVVPMRTIAAGMVSEMGEDGVDVYLMRYGKLPDYYVSKDEALEAGWKKNGNTLHDVLPDKMIGGDVYYNYEKKLPSATGRTWREADFDYFMGTRNTFRILYSNDGLIFVSYDHAQTFYELTEYNGGSINEEIHG